MIRSPSQLPGIFRSEMSGRSSINRIPTMGGLRPLAGGFLRIHRREGKQMPCSMSVFLRGVNPRVDRLVANRAVSVGRSIHGGQCATRLLTQAPADLAGSVPLRQISNHTVAKDLITIQQALLRATPGRAGCLTGLLGPILPVRTRMAGDLTAHHRGATPNQVSDTRLGQAHIHPRHDRRTILNTQHPTTAHNQPLQQHCYHTNCLHPMTLPRSTERGRWPP